MNTFYRWMIANEELRELYARAKQSQLQILSDQIVELADTERICEKVTIKADGSREIVIIDQVDRTRLQIDSRKWLLSKLDPKKYGDKLTHAGDPDAPLGVQLIHSIPRPKRDSDDNADRD